MRKILNKLSNIAAKDSTEQSQSAPITSTTGKKSLNESQKSSNQVDEDFRKVTDPTALKVKAIATEFFGPPYSTARINGGTVYRISIPIRGLVDIYRHVPLSTIKPEDRQIMKDRRDQFIDKVTQNGIDPSLVDVKYHVGAGVYASVRVKLAPLPPAYYEIDTQNKSSNQVDEVSAAAMGHAAEREFANQDFAAPAQRHQPSLQNSQAQRKVYIVMKGSNKKVGQAYTNFQDAQRARAKMPNPEQYSMIKEDGTPISEKKIMELSKNKVGANTKKTNESKSRRAFKVIAEGAEFNVSDSGLARVLKRFPHEVKVFKDGGDLGDALYDALYDHYSSTGEMPYGTMKARDGDPYEWVSQQLDRDISYDTGLTEGSGVNSDIEGILKKYPYEARQFREFGELDDNEMYQELFDHYLNSGEMPYGVAKARTGDPVQWVANRLEKDIGLDDDDDDGYIDSARELSSHEDYAPPMEGMGGDVMPLESVGDNFDNDYSDGNFKNDGYEMGKHEEDEEDDEDDDFTDYTMRQGEMGNPDRNRGVDESMLMDDQEQAVTHKLSSLGYDEGLDFFFENGELTVIGKSTAIAIVNALKADSGINGAPSISGIDGEEIHISFNSDLGEGLADDFAAMANNMKNKDGSQRFHARVVTPDQKRQERAELDAKRAADAAARPPVAPGPDTTNNGSFGDTRGYGQGRYMGDSKINKGNMLNEDANMNLNVSGTDDVLAVLRKLSGLPGDETATEVSPDVSVDDFSDDATSVDDINQEPSMRGMMDMMSAEPELEVVPELAADAAAPEVEVEEEYANEPDETLLPGYGSARGDKDGQGRSYKMTSPGNNPMAETRSLMRQYKGMLSSIKK